MRRSSRESGVRRRSDTGSAVDDVDLEQMVLDQDAPVSTAEFAAPPTTTIPWLFSCAGNPSFADYVDFVVDHDTAYDSVRGRRRSPGARLVDVEPAIKPRIRRPSRSTYSDWKNGHAVPNVVDFGAAVALLIELLRGRAIGRGHRDLPSSELWISHLRSNQPRKTRRPRAETIHPTRGVLADWCVTESQRHLDAIARLPYLEGHPDPTGQNVPTRTLVGLPHQGADSGVASGVTTTGEHASSLEWPQPYLDVVAQFRHVVVAGDAGSGKTWLLCHHAIDLARSAHRALSETGSSLNDIVLPFLVRADTLADAYRPGRSLAETAIAALANSGARLSSSVAAQLLAHIQQRPVYFLIDALDETTTSHRATLDILLSPPDNTHPNTRYIGSTRLAGGPSVFANVASRVEVQLLPLDDPEPYIDSWQLPKQRRDELADLLESNPALTEMARVPLLLAFLCHLARDPNVPIPDTRAELYERTIRRFLSEEHHTANPNPSRAQRTPFSTDPAVRIDEILDVLRPLAYRVAADPDGWVDTVSRNAMLAHLKEVDRPGVLSPAAMLAVLSNDSGVLVPTGAATAGRTPAVRFLHRSLAEYLVAAHLAANPSLIAPAALSHLHLSADWHQTWLLTVQLSPRAALEALTNHPMDALHLALKTAAAAVADLNEEQLKAAAAVIEALSKKCAALVASRSASPQVRTLGVEALEQVGGRVAERALVDCLAALCDRAWINVRDLETFSAQSEISAVVHALMEVAVTSEGLDILLDIACDEERDPFIREEILNTLPILIYDLDDEGLRMAFTAINRLAQTRSEAFKLRSPALDILELIADLAADGTDQQLVEESARGLADIASDQSAESALAAQAAALLGEVDHPTAADALGRLLLDERPAVWCPAAAARANDRDQSAVDRLATFLSDTAPQEAEPELEDLAPRQSVAILSVISADSDPAADSRNDESLETTRLFAALTLTALGDDSGVRTVCEMAADDKPRMGTSDVSGKFWKRLKPDPALLSAVIALLADRDQPGRIRRGAASVLSELVGTFGPDVDDQTKSVANEALLRVLTDRNEDALLRLHILKRRDDTSRYHTDDRVVDIVRAIYLDDDEPELLRAQSFDDLAKIPDRALVPTLCEHFDEFAGYQKLWYAQALLRVNSPVATQYLESVLRAPEQHPRSADGLDRSAPSWVVVAQVMAREAGSAPVFFRLFWDESIDPTVKDVVAHYLVDVAFRFKDLELSAALIDDEAPEILRNELAQRLGAEFDPAALRELRQHAEASEGTDNVATSLLAAYFKGAVTARHITPRADFATMVEVLQQTLGTDAPPQENGQICDRLFEDIDDVTLPPNQRRTHAIETLWNFTKRVS